ncbi:ankyrin repeat domain-containing protein, chloroplastic-like isoform X3 [Phoenix dactylifera]|uniref:Ankyrin repeat domain-containing protein, chloroplastic-like isoform X3 n=1 Tax=Phoenix dactylifera TaxID=42345 RepID=A0A8B9AAL1_PHODC|nr:ankyrin repeat domain-containing protein, chloroplastic-like isoform X3 [Phoenix dactylifera]
MPPPSSLLLSLKSPIQIPSLPASLSPFQAKRHPPPSPFPKPFFPSSFSPLAATPTSFPYSFSPNPFQNPNQDDREIPSLGGGDDDEDDEIVVGDCLVFEEGAFEDGDPFPTPETGREVERPRRRKPAAKKADSALEHENLVPEKWKEVVEEINLTKKEKRKISHQLKFGSRLERRKPPRLPDMEEYRAYREMKLSQLNPVVLDNPREFSPEKEAVVPPEPEGGRVVPRNPRLEMGGGTLEDITDFFNSGDYVPGAIDDDKMPQGRRKLFTKDEKVLLNKRIPNLAEATSSKWLPIHTLAASGEFYLLDALLKQNVDINAIDKDGATLIHYAVQTAASQTIKILLLYNVDINFSDNDGWTPLHLAVQTRRTDIVRLLLIKGADKTLKNRVIHQLMTFLLYFL